MKKPSSYPVLAVLGVLVLLTMAGPAQLAGIASAQAPGAGGSRDVMVISGLPGFQALAYGQNHMSLAVLPVSRDDNRITFKVTGIAATSPGAGTATVYTISEPLPGFLDLSRNRLQIDMTNFNTAAGDPVELDNSRVPDALRMDDRTMIVDVTMNYKSLQGYEAKFSVSGIDVASPDGQKQSYTLPLPAQLVIDGETLRMSMALTPAEAKALGNML